MQEYFEEKNNDTYDDNNENDSGEPKDVLLDANDPRASEEQKQDLINILN